MVRIPYQKDHFNPVRTEYSTMLRRQLAQGNNGLTKTKYLTFGIEAESMKQAKPVGAIKSFTDSPLSGNHFQSKLNRSWSPMWNISCIR